MDRFITFLLVIYGGISITPIAGSFIPTIYQLSLLIVLLLFVLRRLSLDSIDYQKTLIVSIFVFCAITLSYKLLNISSAAIGNVYNQLSFWCNIIFGIYVLRYVQRKEGLFLIVILWGISIFNIIDNIVLYRIFGQYIGTSFEDALIGTNFGGTPFNAYSFVFFTANYYVLLNAKKGLYKLLSLGGALLSMYYMFFCGARGTVVLLDFFVILILPATIIINRNKSAKPVVIGVLSVFFIVVAFFMDSIANFFISIAPDRLAARFEDLNHSVTSGVTDDSFSGRFGLYKVSIESFFGSISSFLFGIGDHRGSISGDFSYAEMGIGGHSEVLDQCARFGLLGIFFTYKILKGVKMMFTSMARSDVHRRLIINILIAFFFCACIKSVLYSNIGFAMFVILPLAIKFEQYINEKIWL